MKKAKLTTTKNINAIKKWWDTEGKGEYRKDLDKATAEKRNWTSRNGHCNGAWCVPGSSGYTMLVKAAGLPYDDYWSGSNPTPSTQYPDAIYRYLLRVHPQHR